MINNDYWKGLLYVRLGLIYYNTCIYGRALEYLSQSYKCYESADKNLHKYYSLFWMARCELYTENFQEADSLALLVQDWAYENTNFSLYKDAIHLRLEALFYLDDIDGINYLYDKYLSQIVYSDNSERDTISLALYSIKTKDFSKAEYYLSRISNSIEPDSVYYNFYNYLLAKEREIRRIL